MRIWDISCKKLCKNHLLGEHRELHAIWSILTSKREKSPYWNHPEVQRWRGNLIRLRTRHEEQVEEIEKRGWNHKSPLDDETDGECNLLEPLPMVHTIEQQIKILKGKKCQCKL